MFNWVCPNCGKDVPPSKTECPYCHGGPEKAAVAPPPPAPPSQGWSPQQPQAAGWQPAAPMHGTPQPSSTPGPQPWQPPVQAPPQGWQPAPQQPERPGPEQHHAPPPPPPPPHAGWPPQHQYPPAGAAWASPSQKPPPPTWLLGLGFALAFLVAGALLYFGVQRFGRTNVQEKAGLENPANPSQQKVSNPLQKYVEVVGIRMVSQDKKPAAKFIVVNHSNAEITGLAANVTLWASTSRSEEDSVGSFTFNLGSLGPYGSKELTAPLKTKLKPYELPDWQNATAEIQITSPQP